MFEMRLKMKKSGYSSIEVPRVTFFQVGRSVSQFQCFTVGLVCLENHIVKSLDTPMQMVGVIVKLISGFPDRFVNFVPVEK